MDLWQSAALLGAVVLAGMLREAYSQFKRWKVRRLELPDPIRNAGFLTDRKLFWFERLGWVVALLPFIWTGALVLWIVGAERGWVCWPLCSAITVSQG